MSYQNLEVLEFYKTLPFNIDGDVEAAIKRIKSTDPIKIYTELKKIFDEIKDLSVIDFGCGGGWLVNSLAYHHKNLSRIDGVDYNPVAINYAEQIKRKLLINSNFYNSDLFTFSSQFKYNLIISLGALHHTNNCIKAIKTISKYAHKNSYIFLGLYHKYGRRPFLQHFDKMKEETEEYKFNEYKKLHNIKDEKKLFSWFRDQVLHPHETQHTYEEMLPVFRELNFEIISTSINDFKPIKSNEDIIKEEKNLFDYGLKKINKNEYYPGFFIIVAKNKN